MKRTIAVAFVLLFAIGASAAEVTGVWTASVDEKKPGRVYLSIARDRGFDMGMSREISRLPGLANADLRSPVQVPVNFELRAEAGTALLGGTFRNGHGAGHFVFNPDRTYIDKLTALGVEFDLYSKRYADEDSTLLTLATHDVSTAYIKSMREAGYNETLKTYLSMRIHDVTPEYVRELRNLGYDKIAARDLTQMRIHGVTPDYIRELNAAGYKDVPVRKLISMRIHGLDVRTIEKLNAMQ